MPLNYNTQYYARVKHIGTEDPESSWSSPVAFTTQSPDIPDSETAVILPANAGYSNGSRSKLRPLFFSNEGDFFLGVASNLTGNAPVRYFEVYTKSGGIWSLSQEFSFSGFNYDEIRNPSVSLNGEFLVITYDPYTNGASGSGRVYKRTSSGYDSGVALSVGTNLAQFSLISPDALTVFISATWPNILASQMTRASTLNSFGTPINISSIQSSGEVQFQSCTTTGAIVIHSEANSEGILSGTKNIRITRIKASSYAASFTGPQVISGTTYRRARISPDGSFVVISDDTVIRTYVLSGANYVLESTIPNPGSLQYFGFHLHLSADGSALCASGRNISGVWFYRRISGGWSTGVFIQTSNIHSSTTLSEQVSAVLSDDGKKMAVGNVNTPTKGGIYLFE